jgi:hypothetical protein
MTKMKGFKLMTAPEKRRLRRELKQGWRTVPPHTLDRARELAGVEAGKEHVFRTAAVQNVTLAFESGKDRAPCTAQLPQPDIEIKFWLSDIDGNTGRKELRVSVLAGGLPGNGTERRQFQSDEQAHDWLQFVLLDLAYQLPFELRTTILNSIEESIYKACERFNLHNFDETKRELSERHQKIVRDRKRTRLQTKKGPTKGRKWSRVTREQIARVPELIRQLHKNGERATRPAVAQLLKLRGNARTRAKSLDRALDRWRPGESWSEIVEDAIKMGH